MLTAKELQILNTINQALPKMDENQQDRLLYFGEGMLSMLRFNAQKGVEGGKSSKKDNGGRKAEGGA